MATKVKLISDGVITPDQITLTTASTGTNTTAPATTAFVQQEISALVDSSPEALNTLNELAAALGDDANFSTTVTNSIATKAPLASPTFTGTAEIPNLTIGGAQGTDGQLLTSTGSGIGWEDAPAGGPTFKTFGTNSIMVGDDATGSLSSANYNTGLGVDIFTALTSGDYNTAAGYGALGDGVLTGEGNTGLGMYALRKNTSGSGNVAIGWDASIENLTGSSNVAIGKLALKTSTAGSQNVAIGQQALQNFTESFNTAVGYRAMLACTSGERNTAIGYDTMVDLQTSENNTALGWNALKLVTGGDNTAIGSGAGDATTSGTRNVYVGIDAGGGGNGSENCIVGRRAGQSNTASYIAAFGTEALQNNTGAANTAIGMQALMANTSGTQNTATGYQALTANLTGSYNVAVGSNCLLQSTSGELNIAIGYEALRQGNGSNNQAFGYRSMYYNTTGSTNIGIGRESLLVNSSGDGNVAIGSFALDSNTTASSNTAVGVEALAGNTTGAVNTAMGYQAGRNITIGQENICIGYLAGGYQNNLTTGSSNTVIGAYARTSSATAAGEIAIGRYVLGQGSYTATLGQSGNGVSIPLNDSTTAWSKHSDERLKENIVDSIAGLSFINDLRPVTYTWKAKKDISPDFTNHYDADSNEPVQGREDTTYHGFLAQEVKEVIDNHPEIQNGNAIWRESPDGIQNLADGAFMPMMVKAMQELSTQVDELKSELLALKGE